VLISANARWTASNYKSKRIFCIGTWITLPDMPAGNTFNIQIDAKKAQFYRVRPRSTSPLSLRITVSGTI
jgi:hypothetical protein